MLLRLQRVTEPLRAVAASRQRPRISILSPGARPSNFRNSKSRRGIAGATRCTALLELNHNHLDMIESQNFQTKHIWSRAAPQPSKSRPAWSSRRPSIISECRISWRSIIRHLKERQREAAWREPLLMENQISASQMFVFSRSN